MRLSCHTCALLPTALFFIATSIGARAQDRPVIYRDVETKYVFGFTEGSGIGLEGEKEFSFDSEARIGKRDGRYGASETKLEFEFTPNQYVQFEFGPFISAHQIRDVTDLDNRSQVAFGGIFGEIRYLLLDRGPSSPLALTLSVEPEWRRIDETNGERVTNVELEVKLNADLELIKNRLYLGANLLYEPEGTHDPDHIGAGWEKESKGGVSAALAYRIVPSVFIGAEVWYLRHYEGAWFNTFTGDAVYVGPTLYVQLAPKVFMTAAWNTQVHGSDVEDPGASLNLSEFSRHRAKLKVAFEF
ncbi:MAG TPA: hypothetical protein VLN61_13065 [Pseudolabrys sp.]|nr:hypothetical protein [Pseudolabrys sp.]